LGHDRVDQPDHDREYLTVAEVAAALACSEPTVRRETDRGELRARHVGRQLRIEPAHFRTYLDRDET
jgi:excisionase family DNA binding protein